jgi:UV DNA damage endonuclease
MSSVPRRLGYACISMKLSYPREYAGAPRGTKPIMTNRSMVKRTFDSKGVSYASQLGLQNVKDLKTILLWNHENKFDFYRVSSDVFPWASHYAWEQMPDYDQICQVLSEAGSFAAENDMRITTHPGPFNKLTSDSPTVTKNTIRDLENHAWMFDRMNLPRTPWAKINIHVGATYGNKQKACDNFCRNFDKLSDAVKSRLTVENDDKASLYSVKDLHEMIHKKIGIPIVFDYHHHKFCSGGMSEQEALHLAASTWGSVVPATHYSESRSIEQNDPKIKPQAHSDYVNGPVDAHGLVIDTMIEAKHKELAVLRLRDSLTTSA